MMREVIASLAELTAYAERAGIEEAARCFEPEEEARGETDARMLRLLPVMRQSVEDGMDPALRSMSCPPRTTATDLSKNVYSQRLTAPRRSGSACTAATAARSASSRSPVDL